MSAPTVVVMASDPSFEVGAQSLKVPEISINPIASDLSDNDSVLRDDTDSMTSESDSDRDTTERHIKQDTCKESTTPISSMVQPTEPQQEDQEVAYDGKRPPAPKTIAEISEDIMGVLARYRLAHQNDINKPWAARSMFRDQVERFVTRQEPVRLTLPAFPFKSPNKTTKVLGTLPDKGEEVALSHLQGLCSAIKDVYGHGADVYIVSDGLMYNDILGISDAEAWRYGQALAKMANDCGCRNIKFLRLPMLLGEDTDGPTTEEEYLKDVHHFRDSIIERYLPPGFDVETHIKKDSDSTLTYRGYIKFLETDLAERPADAEPKSKSQLKRTYEEIAKKMIVRGKAFAASIAQNIPEYVRLSIHASTETTKLSMSLLPQLGRAFTPWHSSLVRAVDGSITMSHARDVPALTHELIFDKDGHPSYFRERSPLFSWPGMDVEFNYIYPTGIIITPRDPSSKYSLRNVQMQKVRALSEACSPVILRNFTDTTDAHIFESKAHDAGTVAPWTFGIRQAVKDAGSDSPKASTVTSNEAMPMHYDGMFFTKKELDPATGEEKLVSKVPRFQYFTSITSCPDPDKDGLTLFASSQLFLQHLPSPYTLQELQSLTWDCKHSSNWSNHMTNLPLITPHPSTKKPCLRWHEPWYKWQTKFATNEIRINDGEEGKQHYKDLIREMLYDRRVCLYFGFRQGDILVADNISMLHTRTAFPKGTGRELWRIHFN
ncbi:MAG: hypothetical protein Q9188_001722 [Gyalolechia gomerana]